MDDLIAFLGARLDEDEAAAKEAGEDSGPEWNCFPEGLRGGIVVAGDEIVVYDEGRPAEAEAEHIARHDPARVLREVAAGRAILVLHRPDLNEYTDGDGDDRSSVDCWTCETGGVPDSWPCPTIRAIAAVYSDHPDYDPGWKP